MATRTSRRHDIDDENRRRSNHRHARRDRGLTCANCRARKVRCDGGQPSCKACEVYHDECRYDKTPPISQVIAMAQRLQHVEEELAALRSGVGRDSPLNGASATERGATIMTVPTLDTNQAAQSEHRLAGRADSHASILAETPAGGIMAAPTQELGTTSHEQEDHASRDEPTTADLSVDEHGKICYYGPTSAVHDPPHSKIASPTSATDITLSAQTQSRSFLVAYGKESATWEEFALGNASLDTGIPRQIMARLLHLHWTWVSPMFMWVYRPAFVRDMATGGRYYSDFLLTVICAHAAKYQDSNWADLLLARARRLLGTAIQQPSSIPTVQALLQLSARDLAHGLISQAWVYSGIAFRMASDLGLQHTGPDIKGMSPVDLEVRRRLFWSCYFWDKATSLYAGRLPAVTEVLHEDTLDMLDDSMELEVWSPYYGDSLNLTRLAHDQYPRSSSHSISCFVNSCKLSIIINDIIMQIYSRKDRTITEEALKSIKARLDLWRAQSPIHLRYDPADLPALSPPPHVISQNLLYFSSVILAHRPLWSVPAYYRVCINASESIEKLVLLLESTFGLDNITYLMGYCIYTGASAILEDAKKDQGARHPVLKTFLRALNAGMRRCPLLERSLNIIVKGLNRPSSHTTTTNSGTSRVNTESLVTAHIPAFPYLGSSEPVDFDMDPTLGAVNIDSMLMLDSYPEMQMDMGEMLYQSFE